MNIVDWGLIDFEEAWQRQRDLSEAVLISNEPDTLVLCEHPSVVTLGRTTQDGAVTTDRDDLAQRGIRVIEIDRGGEATIHNPGQLVGYPIFHLQRTKPDLHWFLRNIEHVIIRTVRSYSINGEQIDGLTGVWVGGDRKICAIGIHCKRWVSTHGFALNVNNDLSLFNDIVPCGIMDKSVTSIAQEIGYNVEMDAVKEIVATSFQEEFAFVAL